MSQQRKTEKQTKVAQASNRAVHSGSKVNNKVLAKSPEVSTHKPRRRFSAEYKLQILSELDRVSFKERGGIIRREGLYSSSISEWRAARNAGQLGAFQRRQGRPSKSQPQDLEMDALNEKIAQLESKLAQAEIIIEIQKKVSKLFGINP